MGLTDIQVTLMKIRTGVTKDYMLPINVEETNEDEDVTVHKNNYEDDEFILVDTNINIFDKEEYTTQELNRVYDMLAELPMKFYGDVETLINEHFGTLDELYSNQDSVEYFDISTEEELVKYIIEKNDIECISNHLELDSDEPRITSKVVRATVGDGIYLIM